MCPMRWPSSLPCTCPPSWPSDWGKPVPVRWPALWTTPEAPRPPRSEPLIEAAAEQRAQLAGRHLTRSIARRSYLARAGLVRWREARQRPSSPGIKGRLERGQGPAGSVDRPEPTTAGGRDWAAMKQKLPTDLPWGRLSRQALAGLIAAAVARASRKSSWR